MKKWIISLAIVGIIGFVGYKVGMHYVSDKMMDKVSDQVLSNEEVDKMMQDPEVHKLIEQNFGKEEAQKLFKDADVPTATDSQKENSDSNNNESDKGTSNGSNTEEKTKLVVKSKAEATDLLMSKFSMGELADFASKANGGLTNEEKNEIKNKLLSRLTKEEYEAIKIVGLMELANRK